MNCLAFQPKLLLSGLLLTVLMITGAQAQQPTKAQQSAIRASCSSDFQANCAGVSPGGQEALQCLQTNVAKLSAACQSAVNAIGGGAASGATPAAPPPAAATAPSAPPAATTAAPAPTVAPVMLTPRQELALVRQSCGRDVRRLCAGVPMGGGRVAACLQANAAALSPGCRGALASIRP
ncbi:hypothetical protein FHS85_001254 [Rhodoligotrophos appendicifer]|uniref:hypothetical protein n=1 Tax=Rhodoligotrophos appendicifer TaxID=987056 RepID=UPI00118481CD|nr:hypothetical protein [Rhodoligotrophos appendicifer]